MKMMFAALALLAGCSTVSSLQSKDPETFRSEKSPGAVVICISDGWLQKNPETRVNPTAGGQRIIAGNAYMGQTYLIADVRPDGEGSVIEYRAISMPGSSWPKSTVSACL